MKGERTMKVKTWLANEIEFVSEKHYDNPFEDVDIDVVFTLGRKKMTVPAFWDGGDIWRVRFALPAAGKWKYETKTTDASNKGFIASGTVECVPYDGELEIYKHGFVKTVPNVRYFMYNDGTPFFYLGDTHWNFACEEFDSAGEHADGLECDSHFKYIVDKRVQQGFSVYQSEPIGAKYNLSRGLDEKAVEGFRDLDRRFKYIADAGLVHANAQLLFPRELCAIERYDDKKYIYRLARYWAARYSAYPVLWTLGQEVDNDFYFNRGDQKRFTKETNPFKLIAAGLYENDPHRHPITGHMESCSLWTGFDGEGTCVSTSSFREVEGHTWYGYQWSPWGTGPIDPEFARDGWVNGQGKVLILYESRYDYLWTGHFGARKQGWLAYLNGLYGYGYGAIDIWLYKSKYDVDKTSNDGFEEITPEFKAKHWAESIEFETAYQMGYMKDFFMNLEWWKLIPRFNSPAFFIAEKENFYSLASDERNTIVIYFFGKDKFETGMLTNLDDATYSYQWFNPRTGVYSEKRTFVPDVHRTYKVETKPDKLDWVLLVKKVK